MIIVAGANLFQQWFLDFEIVENFTVSYISNHNNIFNLERAKLICISWSYNILEIDNNLIISGTWCGKKGQIVKLPVPDKCKHHNLIITCNDYNIIIVDSIFNTVHVFDLKAQSFKEVTITEKPIMATTLCKQINDHIIKAVATNYTCIYLTELGNVFVGILPSYIDTKHCLGRVCDVQCGYEHYVLLTETGGVYSWGNGRRLQLGHGDIDNLEIPTEVEALSGIKIVKITAGGWHSIALSESGDAYIWGWNDTGQLGTAVKNNTDPAKNFGLPNLIDIYDENGKQVELNVRDISCGTKHSAILLEDHSVWTTGCNKYGQLGFPHRQYERLNYFKKSYNAPESCRLLSVPQDCILRLILFNIFTKFLISNHSNHLIYADDLKIVRRTDTIDEVEMLLRDLKTLTDRYSCNGMYLNTKKCHVLRFSKTIVMLQQLLPE